MSICQCVDISMCRYVNESICQCVYMSMCLHVNVSIILMSFDFPFVRLFGVR